MLFAIAVPEGGEIRSDTGAGLSRTEEHLFVYAIAVVGLFFFAVAVILRRRTLMYKAHIHYDIAADYPFVVDPAFGRTLTMEATSDGLIWPQLDDRWDSAFLELSISADFVGRILDPYVEIELGGRVLRQYLERGAAGRRLLNVTPFLLSNSSADGRLAIHGHRLSWKSDGVVLHLLTGARLQAGPVLVMAPHPDDAEIAAYGLYSNLQAWVVTVTAGDVGSHGSEPFFDDSVEAHLESARARVWESILIPQTAGVPAAQLVNLGYFDGTLRGKYYDRDQPVSSIKTRVRDVAQFRKDGTALGLPRGPRDATWSNLVEDLRVLLRAIEPVHIVLPHPSLDEHPDHQFAAIALLEALEASELKRGSLLFYTNHPTASSLYPFGPSDGMVSIPPLHGTDAYFQSVLSIPLDTRVRFRKQLALNSSYDMRPALSPRRQGLGSMIKQSLKEPYRHLVIPDFSYDRRAPRPNEIFLVVNYRNGEKVRNAFIRRNVAAGPRSE